MQALQLKRCFPVFLFCVASSLLRELKKIDDKALLVEVKWSTSDLYVQCSCDGCVWCVCVCGVCVCVCVWCVCVGSIVGESSLSEVRECEQSKVCESVGVHVCVCACVYMCMRAYIYYFICKRVQQGIE